LKFLIARFLKYKTSDLTIIYNEFGKPMLQPEKGQPVVHFNASHSGDYALLGFSKVQVLGVDLEKTEERREWRGILSKHFDVGEQRYVSEGGGETEQIRRFYRLWTLKEAWIKCEGTGLFTALENLHLPMQPLKEGRPLFVQGYSLLSLDPGPDYSAALAVQGPLGGISAWRADPEQILAGA